MVNACVEKVGWVQTAAKSFSSQVRNLRRQQELLVEAELTGALLVVGSVDCQASLV
jgi:hypothetical protein